MIDINDIPFGTEVFYVSKEINTLTRKRITFVDSDGVQWYRYDKPIITYKIQRMKYVGKLINVTFGEPDPEIEYDYAIYSFVDENGKYDNCFFEELRDPKGPWFQTKEAAEEYVQNDSC